MSNSADLVSKLESELQRVEDDLKGVDSSFRRYSGSGFDGMESREERRDRRRSTDDAISNSRPKRRRSIGGGGDIFSRLGAPVSESSKRERSSRKENKGRDEDGDLMLGEDYASEKPAVLSAVHAVNKTRMDALTELRPKQDRTSMARNKRFLGILTGTLQQFRTDEAKQKDKEEMRVAVEQKLEEKGRAVREEMRKERQKLYDQRMERQARIKRLAFNMARVKEHEAWEAHQRSLSKFIRTKAAPAVFWMPKKTNSKIKLLIKGTKETIEAELEDERVRLKEELQNELGVIELGPVSEEEEEYDLEKEEFGHNPDIERERLPLRERQLVEKEESSEHEYAEIEVEEDGNSEVLNFEAEEGELVYENVEPIRRKGKAKKKHIRERVVVQVNTNEDVDGYGGERKVALLPSLDKSRGREVVEVTESKAQRKKKKKKASEGDADGVPRKVRKLDHVVSIPNGRPVSGKKKKKEKKAKHKKESKKKSKVRKVEMTKGIFPKEYMQTDFSQEFPRPQSIQVTTKASQKIVTATAQVNPILPSALIKQEPSDKPKEIIVKDKKPPKPKEQVVKEAEEPEEIWSEDLSHISLPLEPEPADVRDEINEDPQEKGEGVPTSEKLMPENGVQDASMSMDRTLGSPKGRPFPNDKSRALSTSHSKEGEPINKQASEHEDQNLKKSEASGSEGKSVESVPHKEEKNPSHTKENTFMSQPDLEVGSPRNIDIAGKTLLKDSRVKVGGAKEMEEEKSEKKEAEKAKENEKARDDDNDEHPQIQSAREAFEENEDKDVEKRREKVLDKEKMQKDVSKSTKIKASPLEKAKHPVIEKETTSAMEKTKDSEIRKGGETDKKGKERESKQPERTKDKADLDREKQNKEAKLKEIAAKEHEEKKRKEKERRERAEREMREIERKEKERRELEKKERERRELEKREKEKRELEKKEKERKELEKKEKERRELEKKEKERKELQKREKERKELEKKEKEKREKERKEKEKKEKEHKEMLERKERERKIQEKKRREKLEERERKEREAREKKQKEKEKGRRKEKISKRKSPEKPSREGKKRKKVESSSSEDSEDSDSDSDSDSDDSEESSGSDSSDSSSGSEEDSSDSESDSSSEDSSESESDKDKKKKKPPTPKKKKERPKTPEPSDSSSSEDSSSDDSSSSSSSSSSEEEPAPKKKRKISPPKKPSKSKPSKIESKSKKDTSSKEKIKRSRKDSDKKDKKGGKNKERDRRRDR